MSAASGACCFAWGAGTQGQLGAGDLCDALVPTRVQLPAGDVAAVWCGANHALCVTAQGAAFVWGLSHLQEAHQDEGEAGQAAQHGDTLCAVPWPLQLSAAVRIRRVAAGWAHTLLLSEAGALFVAGDNGFGQLGVGQQLASSEALLALQLPSTQQQGDPGSAVQPAAAAPRARAADVAAGMRHSLVLLEQLEAGQQQQQGCSSCVLGWGSNKWQQLGPDDRGAGGRAVMWRPHLLRGVLPAGTVLASVAAGGDRSAGVTSDDGRLLLWGRPLPGGHVGSTCEGGTATCWPHPVRPAGWLHGGVDSGSSDALRWRSVCLGWRHVAALDAAGQVWAAGDNSLCQLGQQPHAMQQQGTEQQQQQRRGPPPWLVQLPAPAICLAAGAEHTAALLQGGRVVTWGWGEHGQLGTGGTADAATPQLVPLGSGWRASGVACGAGFTVAWGSSSGSNDAL